MSLNRVRGEAEIAIAGKFYRLALTLDALARAADALGEPDLTFSGFVARLNLQRASDMPLLLGALLAGNGHDVAMEDIRRANPLEYLGAVAQLFPQAQQPDAKPEAKSGNGRAGKPAA